uniref:Chloride channel protein n=1 Tax=Bursaphelenchus xylophilus TaxID=6326 RepID=A0A1I7SE43_BURXY
MKTILRGVILKDYLTFRTLLSKFIGLTFSLGSGVPIGKVGPFVHLASIAANLLSNLAASFDGAYGNECRKSEMLAAACAVGVACCFSAPVGGVLFSIEVTTMYFSVRNYWRGFFAAACGATVFRLLRVVLLHSEATLVAFYQTDFPKDAFEYEELPFFALIGVICGFVAATYIIFYRSLVLFLRQNDYAKKFFQKNWIVYPIVVSFFVASITYPRGYGRFLTGRYKFTQTIVDLFSNCTFTKPMKSAESPHGCTLEQLSTWTNHEGYGPYNFFVVVTLFAFTFNESSEVKVQHKINVHSQQDTSHTGIATKKLVFNEKDKTLVNKSAVLTEQEKVIDSRDELELIRQRLRQGKERKEQIFVEKSEQTTAKLEIHSENGDLKSAKGFGEKKKVLKAKVKEDNHVEEVKVSGGEKLYALLGQKSAQNIPQPSVKPEVNGVKPSFSEQLAATLEAKKRQKEQQAASQSKRGSRSTFEFDENDDSLLRQQQDAFDFSLLKAKLEQRLAGNASDSMDEQAYLDNMQQKQEAIKSLRSRLTDTGNVQRAKKKWLSMEKSLYDEPI